MLNHCYEIVLSDVRRAGWLGMMWTPKGSQEKVTCFPWIIGAVGYLPEMWALASIRQYPSSRCDVYTLASVSDFNDVAKPTTSFQHREGDDMISKTKLAMECKTKKDADDILQPQSLYPILPALARFCGSSFPNDLLITDVEHQVDAY